MQERQQDEPITIALAAIVNSANQMLLVRKAGTTSFMQPGGKIDAGETPREALDRELMEEIGVRLEGEVVFCGVYEDDATNEPGRRVRGHAFFSRCDISAAPSGEIEELRWIPLATPGELPIAQLSVNHIFPLARQMSGTIPHTHRDAGERL